MKTIIPHLIWIVLFYCQSALACSCIETNERLETKVKKAFNQSEFVFIGNVQHITSIKNDDPFSSYSIVTMEVKNIYKGELIKKILKIRTNLDSASCGFHFEQNKTYLVYTYSYEGKFWDGATGLCTRTKALNRAQRKERRYLRKNKRCTSYQKI